MLGGEDESDRLPCNQTSEHGSISAPILGVPGTLGLLQLGDSRDIIVDILIVLIDANKNKENISSEEIRNRTETLRIKYSLETKGLAESNIRRQLKRLRDAMLIEKSENKYYLAEHSSLSEIFENSIERFIIPQTIERIKEYLDELNKI